ncbi:hypothetical protein C8Q80DRAFT_889961 [Daedaleopsis nitida]|nr:hypothetical protein C8Q80DRAFT_889961 [Daedaleopsis nitida]
MTSRTSEVQNIQPGPSGPADSDLLEETQQLAQSQDQLSTAGKSSSLEEVPTSPNAAQATNQPGSPVGEPPAYTGTPGVPGPSGTSDSSSSSPCQRQEASKANPKKLVTVTLPPHILVLNADGGANSVNAWGRTTVALLGYRKFAEQLFAAYIMHPASAPPRGGRFRKSAEHKAFWAKYRAAQSHFVAYVRIFGTFAQTSGGADAEGPVRLQSAGWTEMIRNVVELRVEYDPQWNRVQESARTEGSGEKKE